MDDLVRRLRDGANRVAKYCMSHDVGALISIPVNVERDIDRIMIEAADALEAAQRKDDSE